MRSISQFLLCGAQHESAEETKELAHRIVVSADTEVVVDEVKAGASIETGSPQCAVIHVNLALTTHIPLSTRAVECIEQVLGRERWSEKQARLGSLVLCYE